ncbi:putative serine protease PepD [Sinosporangium album]|uniref:Putative serine protease PepD n=1 Tax=Sinosporangium album TaxID=504805 RepID=A0A1G7Y654_9ACTN|nr:trypsin-like peptidase domain-containing protein [Sinosporangium album]SDG91941.1 putative serine protease PepD [Sinosporangium album]
MTDDRRAQDPGEGQGRTPSDAEGSPQGARPDFLPAEDTDPARPREQVREPWDQTPDEEARWGDPAGTGDTASFASPSGPPPPTGLSAGTSPFAGSAGGPGGGYGAAPPPTAPPPPNQAFGMGPGWAPPPPPGAPLGAARPPEPPRSPRTGFIVTLAVVVALVAGIAGSVGTQVLTRGGTSDPAYNLGPAPTGSTGRAPDSVAGVAAKVLPSVVSLQVKGLSEAGTGSGLVIKGGYVLTNNHVVAAASRGGEIQVMFHNRKMTGGRIVGRDPGSDLAVVKPDDTFGTPELVLGNSDNVVVGDPVIAIGSPLGLSGTVTQGIVSSLNRPVTAGDDAGSADPSYINAIQTDAAINPGNSGGPLVDLGGRVIGVNSAIATLGRSMGGQGGSIGLGFAIPVNHARRVAEELISTGVAKRSRIGVALDSGYRGQGVRIATEPTAGAQPVTPGGAADKAGLKAGDVILEMNGTALQSSDELIALIRSKAPGDRINIKYRRGGQESVATVVVEAAEVPVPRPS